MLSGTIEIKLPYPKKIWLFTYFVKRSIGFSFNQRAIFNLLENNKIDLPQHAKWLKETPQSVVVFETIYAAAQSYCEVRRVNDNFTKKGLEKSLIECSDSDKEAILNCWKESEHLGFKPIPSKKKAAKR